MLSNKTIGYLLVLLCLLYPVCMLTEMTKLVFYPMVVASFALWLYGTFARGESFVDTLNLGKPFFLFCGALVFSVFWSEDRGRTLERSAVLLSFAGIFTVANSLLQKGYRIWLVRLTSLLPFVILFCYLRIYRQYGFVRAGTIDMKEEVGAFANTGAAMVILCIPFCIYQLRRKGNPLWARLLALGALGAMAVVFIMSESRAAIVIPAAAILGCFLAISRDRKTFLKNMGLLLAGFLVVAIVAYEAGWVERLVNSRAVERLKNSQVLQGDIFSNPIQQEVDYQRLVMLQTGIEVIRNHWFKGIGYGVFGDYMELATGTYTIAHNLIITAWGECGLPGLITLVYLVGACFVRLFRALRVLRRYPDPIRRENETVFYSLCLVALGVSVLHSMIRPQFNNPMFFLTFTVALAVPPRPVLPLREQAPRQAEVSPAWNGPARVRRLGVVGS
jgi:hypothetical protein